MVDSNPVFPHSKSSFSISRLVWGVIVQGFIRIVRMALEILSWKPPQVHHPQASISDALIPLFHYRSDTDTFEAGNGRYRSDTDTLPDRHFSKEPANNLAY